LQLYGWLFESTFKLKPSRLEVYQGDKTIKGFEYSGGDIVLKEIHDIFSILNLDKPPYSEIEFLKCDDCDFVELCTKLNGGY